MRITNSAKNIATGLVGQALLMALSFFNKTVFIYILGKSYLGINGLFSNVLSILSLSELGLGTAIIFSMYRPLAQGDTKKIQALMNLYRKSYRVIGTVILMLGLGLLPLLSHIIKGDLPTGLNIYTVYLLYLFESVSSYWFWAYLNSLLVADQKNYVVSWIYYLFSVLITVGQAITLLIWTNFLFYLLIGIMTKIIQNLFVGLKVKQMYPYIKEKNNESLNKEEQKTIIKNVLALSMYKISGTVINSTDNIVLSTYIGLSAVGMYSNYLYILASVSAFTTKIFGSLTASIGNLHATENEEKRHFIFKCLSFLNFWIYGFCSISIWVLANPFITLWIGRDYLLDAPTVIIIVVNFLTAGLQNAVISFKDGCGLYWQGKYRAIASAISNIILSVIFVQYWGIFGVLLATVISRFMTTWWFDAWLVHKYAFDTSPMQYYLRYLGYFLIITLVGFLIKFLCSMLPALSWGVFLVMTIICMILPNLIFFALFHRSQEFCYLYSVACELFGDVLKKIFPKRKTELP